MKGLVTIARREVRERRALLAAAAAASLVAAIFPVFRGLTGEAAAQARSGAALILSAAFALGIPIGLGASMIAPRIADRRLTFDLSRPVSGLAIWGGRLAAAATLALLTALIVWVPSRLLGAPIPIGDLFVAEDLTGWPIGLVFLVLVLFGLAHFASLVWRSRSLWLIADLAILAAVAATLPRVLGRLDPVLAAGPWKLAALATVALLGIGVLVAGWSSVAHGRTDVVAAHRAETLALAATLVVALGAVGGYVSWVLAAGPSALSEARFTEAAPTGSWAIVQGEARGAHVNLVYDTKTDRYVRADGSSWRGPQLSADGKRAFWLAHRRGALVGRTLTLDDPNGTPRTTEISLENQNGPRFATLSDDGSRLGIDEEGTLSIVDVSSGRRLASGSLGRAEVQRGFFVGNGRLRVFTATGERGPWRLGIQELDAAQKKIRTTGSIADITGYFALSPDGTRIAVHQNGEALRVFDGSTGALLATLMESAPVRAGSFGFLWDGSVVIVDRSAEPPSLLVYSKDGKLERSIPMPPGDFVTLGGEISPGELAVAIGVDWVRPIYVIGVHTGATRRIADALSLVTPFSTWWGPPYAPRPGSEATRLFNGPNDTLVRLDPETGDQRVLLGRSGPVQ